MKHRVSKSPLPMFYINLKQTNKQQDIYNYKNLLHTKIIFEPATKNSKQPNIFAVKGMGTTKVTAIMQQGM